MKAGKTGVIDIVMKVVNAHTDSAGICEWGCRALCNIATESTLLQKGICEKGGLAILLKVLREHSGNALETCITSIDALLSSPETHSKYCTPEVIRAVEECYEKHKDSEKIKHSLLSLKREEDSRVRDAVARGVCTKEAFPKCSEKCRCDKGYYCSKCCAQQKTFRCLTCDKNKTRFYCEVCWKRDHKGHNGEEFFYPVRCATGHK